MCFRILIAVLLPVLFGRIGAAVAGASDEERF